jgi:hypothetical protein
MPLVRTKKGVKFKTSSAILAARIGVVIGVQRTAFEKLINSFTHLLICF